MSRKRAHAPAADRAALPPPETLFAGLAGAKGLVAAVSGGPDSTALMLLLSGWASRPPTLVVTVDHGLRPEAAAEAALVARNAARLGLQSRSVRPLSPYAGGNLQAWSRDARYACLVQAARECGADTIVTAHHRDDQAETFLLRLARGSGVYGLAAMAAATRLGEVTLARPLLDVPRSALAALVDACGLEVARDPSNDDPRFDRVAMRGLMPALAEHGLTAERLAGTAARLARAADALDSAASSLIAANFVADPCGVVSGVAASLTDAHEEIALRALGRLVAAAAGASYTPRLDRLEGLLAALRNGTEFRRTVHGADVALRGGRLSLIREFGRAGLPFVGASGGDTLIWDGRFRISLPPVRRPVEVGPLGLAGRNLALPGSARRHVASLPGLYGDRRLMAVPAGVHASDGLGHLGRLSVECLVGPRLGLSPNPS